MSTEDNKLAETTVANEPVDDKNEVFNQLPPEVQEHIEHGFSAIALRSEISSTGSEIAKKFNEDHITQFLNTANSEMEHSYEEKKHRKIFSGIILVLVMAFIIVLIVLLKDNPDVMEKILYASGGLIFGALGGYGFGKRSTDDD